MKGKLSFKLKLMIALGFPFLLNQKSGEIHDMRNFSGICGVDKMSPKNRIFLTEKKANRLIGKLFRNKSGKVVILNGCTHCFRQKDLG